MDLPGVARNNAKNTCTLPLKENVLQNCSVISQPGYWNSCN